VLVCLHTLVLPSCPLTLTLGLTTGHWGDRHSRKTSLVYSLLLMAVPTTLMGALPTFKMISWAAPVLLVLLRLFQGLAIGGENGTALV